MRKGQPGGGFDAGELLGAGGVLPLGSDEAVGDVVEDAAVEEDGFLGVPISIELW